MKVMLPVKDCLLHRFEMADGFHNIDVICIYNSYSNSSEWLSAKEISELNDGLNGGLVEKEVHTIISKSITPMVLSMFQRNGINVYKAQSNDVLKNVDLFQNNQLGIFTIEESRQIQNCNSDSCSGCSSKCN